MGHGLNLAHEKESKISVSTLSPTEYEDSIIELTRLIQIDGPLYQCSIYYIRSKNQSHKDPTRQL